MNECIGGNELRSNHIYKVSSSLYRTILLPYCLRETMVEEGSISFEPSFLSADLMKLESIAPGFTYDIPSSVLTHSLEKYRE